MMKVSVHHWRYEDGLLSPNAHHELPGARLDPLPAGWYCWAYTDNNAEFTDWMQLHCPGAECLHRFNSGDPMFTVFISSKEEAMKFRLAWQ